MIVKHHSLRFEGQYNLSQEWKNGTYSIC